jgi:hypothetical protein
MDMDSMRRENEKTTAIGNMPVNARGDQIRGGKITKTADQIARENHRVKTAVVKTGLKGKMPSEPAALEAPKKVKAVPEEKKAASKTKEVELESGDIIIEDDNDSKST